MTKYFENEIIELKRELIDEVKSEIVAFLNRPTLMILRSAAITETQFTRMAASILTAQKPTSAAIFVSAAALIQAEEFPPTVL